MNRRRTRSSAAAAAARHELELTAVAPAPLSDGPARDTLHGAAHGRPSMSRFDPEQLLLRMGIGGRSSITLVAFVSLKKISMTTQQKRRELLRRDLTTPAKSSQISSPSLGLRRRRPVNDPTATPSCSARTRRSRHRRRAGNNTSPPLSRRLSLFGALLRFQRLPVFRNDLAPALPSFSRDRVEPVVTTEECCRSLPEEGNVRKQACHDSPRGGEDLHRRSNRTPPGAPQLLDLRHT
jgi:hypothetical protein